MRQRGATSALFSLFALIAGCATSGDPVADFYIHSRIRGYIDFQVAKGLFKVTAKGNHGLFVSDPESAREVWANRAAALCGSTEYKELSVREYSIQNARGPESMIIAKQPYKDGYVLCKDAEISETEAMARIPKRQ
jgi:hypothetical protein